METAQKFFIFDFDSTLTTVEGLDILAEISLKKNNQKDEILSKIIEITNKGIDGDISFTESLQKRIQLLQANKKHLKILIEELKTKISPSVQKNISFFKEHIDSIYVVSSGFKEFIAPIVALLHIPANKVYANTFLYDENDNIIGFDTSNHLSKHNGKIACLKSMNLKGNIQMIGDGYSDYITKESGVADVFFAFTENITRTKTIEKADYVINSIDEFLSINKIK